MVGLFSSAKGCMDLYRLFPNYLFLIDYAHPWYVCKEHVLRIPIPSWDTTGGALEGTSSARVFLLWNALVPDIRWMPPLLLFRNVVKTCLFQKAIWDWGLRNQRCLYICWESDNTHTLHFSYMNIFKLTMIVGADWMIEARLLFLSPNYLCLVGYGENNEGGCPVHTIMGKMGSKSKK